MVSVFGSSVHLVVVILFLKELTGQAYSIGIFQFVAYLPIILLAPVGGVAADGCNAKRLLVAADLLRAAAMLLMGLLLWKEMLGYGLLLAGTFIVSIGTAFFQPAVHAVFPSVVDPVFLKRGNSVRGAGLLGANFAGTSLGGVLFALIGPAAIFIFNGISFFLSAVEEGFIRFRPRRPRQIQGAQEARGKETDTEVLRTGELRGRLRETMAYLRSDGGALSAIFTYGMIHAVYPPVVVALPFFIDEVLGLGSAAYGYSMALLLAGGGSGALLYGFFSPKLKGNSPLLFASLFLLSGLLLAVGILPRAVVLFPALFAAGLSLGVVHQIMTTSLYRRVEKQSRGRVFGLMESLASAALPISYGISGFLVGFFMAHLPAFFLLLAGISALMTLSVYLHGRLSAYISTMR